MSILWRQASLAALAAAAVAGCASPQYPIRDGDDGPRLSAPKPAYPIADAGSPPAVAAPPAQTPPSASEPAPLAAPTPSVETAPLPPPGPSAALQTRGEARLVLVSTEAESAPLATSAGAAPVAAPPPAPAPAPSTTSDDSSLTPQMVVHDRDPLAPPPVSPNPTSKTLKRTRQAWSTPAPPRRETERAMAAGDVVEASTDVYENYEVQRGDHVDALARAFATTRRTIVEANGLHAPFALHPGQIVKVPVAKAYVARSGDTLPEVARRFSINVDELAELNHLSAHAQLRPGQELGLPSSMRDRGPQRTETEAPQYAEAIAPRPTPAPAVRRDEPGAKATYFAHPYVAGPAQAAPPPEHRIAALGSSAPPVQVERGSGYATTVPPAVAAQAALSDTEIAQAARGRFVWPVRGDIVVRFGQQGIGRRNDGVDIKAAEGTVVKAAAQGEVVYAGDQVPGFGNLVLIKHADGWVTAYAHLQSVDVQMRQQVVQGQSLGQVGTTGGVPEPELHFEVRFAPSPTDKARPVDPVLVLPVG